MRALIFQLRPMTLQEEGLLSALKKHLNAVHSRDGSMVELQVTGSARRLPAPIEDASFRIIQEALNNVIKHARSERARVELDFEAASLRLSVIDTGVGFDPSARRQSGKLGMTSMRERAESAGGTLRIESVPGQGTSVRVEFPVPDDLDAEPQ
jgi:signal transduction histidine kinase